MVEQLLRYTLDVTAARCNLFFWIGPDVEIVAPQYLNIRQEWLDGYVDSMYRKDPLHVARLISEKRTVAALRYDQGHNRQILDSEYEAHLLSIAIGDEIDLIFWHREIPVACLAMMRSPEQRRFKLHSFDWGGLRDYIQATLSLHWRTRSMLTEDFLIRDRGLKPRELDIVRQILIGKDNRQIAEILGIGVGTVKSHVISILNKLGVDSRLAIACFVHDLQFRLN